MTGLPTGRAPANGPAAPGGPTASGRAGEDPARSLRDTLAAYATGVAVVTTTAGGRPAGLTVNSFTSVSLEPPLVLWCIRRDSASLPAFVAAEGYAVNVLAAGQRELATRFARGHADRFAGVGWWFDGAGWPVLSGTVGRLSCVTQRRMALGDHVVLVGRVVDHAVAGGPPLVFHGSRFLIPGLSAV